MNLAATHERVSARYGAPYTLRKPARAAGANSWTAGAETPTYHPCTAFSRGFKPFEIKGGILEGDSLVTITASTISVEPAKGDLISIGTFTDDVGAEWATVVNVNPPKVQGSTVSYRLQVRK